MWVNKGSMVAALVVMVAVGCSSDDDDKETGALPCDSTPSECKAAFADDYEGVYTGDASGRVIFTVDPDGTLYGTATTDAGSEALDGTVNQFGRIQGTASDGTKYDGQFDGNNGFSGTWTSPEGNTGTFAGKGTGVSVPVGTGGSSATGGRSGTATGGRSPTGGTTSTGGTSSTDPILSDPRFSPDTPTICAASVVCGADISECEPNLILLRDIAVDSGCIAQLNAMFACVVDTGACDIPTQCPAQYEAFETCVGF
jgi:hypothetical protein